MCIYWRYNPVTLLDSLLVGDQFLAWLLIRCWLYWWRTQVILNNTIVSSNRNQTDASIPPTRGDTSDRICSYQLDESRRDILPKLLGLVSSGPFQYECYFSDHICEIHHVLPLTWYTCCRKIPWPLFIFISPIVFLFIGNQIMLTDISRSVIQWDAVVMWQI